MNLPFLVCGTVGAAIVGCSAALLACGNDDTKAIGSVLYFPMAYGDHPTKPELASLGRKLFFDQSLSASGKISCATCHDPGHAYGAPNELPVQLGGLELNRTGFRNTPSLRYLHSPVDFTEHFYELDVTGNRDDEGPTGGRTWDGRVNSGHEQALMPLLDQNEMANADTHEIVGRLSRSSYAQEFREAVSAPGENVFDNEEAAIGWMTVAIEAFEQSPADFHPFTSKYDAYLRDQVDLTSREKRGLALFNDPKKGNCASCHPSQHKNPASHLPIFTDFGYVALGAPRNHSLAVNANPSFFDLGLCGPLRSDLKNKTQYCGLFRTPSLRNVALRKSYFHNGQFHSLRAVLKFYVTRDTNPGKWYGRGTDGKVEKFDDLPAKYTKNVYAEPPFAPLPNGKPRLTSGEIDDVVAFLGTLSDGYVVTQVAPTRHITLH